MNSLYKLSDIYEMYGLTRRVIQGYEKVGLIKPTSKTKQGYLLYDEETIKKIAVIRFLQTYCSLKDIKKYLNYGDKGFKVGMQTLEKLLPTLIERDNKNLKLIKSIKDKDINNQNYINKMYKLIMKGE